MKTPELILLQLKALGPHSAKMLAERLDITPMGIRQHLQSLEKRELVCYEEARSKVGRPTRYWSLTERGHAFAAADQERLRASALQLFGGAGWSRCSTRAKSSFICVMPKSCPPSAAIRTG